MYHSKAIRVARPSNKNGFTQSGMAELPGFRYYSFKEEGETSLP